MPDVKKEQEQSQPLVSVIMPAYNSGEFIAASIRSVLDQDYTNWELLIVNDCSTDNTRGVIKSFITDPRIQLLDNRHNLGGAGSRNRAIEHARGRFIAFLDSDDLWSTDKLSKQIGFMLSNAIAFSFSGYSTMTEAGAVKESIQVPEKISFSQLLKHNYIGCLTAVYDAEQLGKVYMPLVRKRQDFALWLEILKQIDFAYGLPANLGFYRIRTGSLSANKKDAFTYYWRVLRDVGECGFFSAAYNISWYMFIVFLKKKMTGVYHKFFIG
ncbi:glycosyltransferase family 2 protein [Alkalimonas collagenimarina]|uniref:Glycosyltransferase family 2 protein n=1 Tax=Alkalimonas collagenimarina TaxID=400390 RepID=A0ABT9H0T2_9GAMM|nr:glycosyltransferase family 2 protein [Alkalimonas collagenimarina]MDP4536912.1 glycosyltransferase family 2 protein [Alkalimonas collagenimarina]